MKVIAFNGSPRKSGTQQHCLGKLWKVLLLMLKSIKNPQGKALKIPHPF